MRKRRRRIHYICSQAVVATRFKSQPNAVYGSLVYMGWSLVYSQNGCAVLSSTTFMPSSALDRFYCGRSHYYRLLLDHQCVRGFLLFLITAAVDSRTAVSLLSSFHGRMYSWKSAVFCDLESPILWHPCSLVASVFRLVVLCWRSVFYYKADDYELDPWMWWTEGRRRKFQKERWRWNDHSLIGVNNN